MPSDILVLIPAGLLVVAQWAAAARLYGAFPWAEARSTAGLVARSGQAVLFCGAAAVLVFGVYDLLHSGLMPTAVRAPLIGLSALLLSTLVLPPAILVLGASDGPAPKLVSEVSRGMLPLRITHLLRLGSGGDLIVCLSGVRNHGWASWRDSVHAAARVAKTIVIDTRAVSQAVLEETADALAPEFVAKAVFVVYDDEASPVLKRLAHRLNTSLPHLRTATAEQLVHWVTRLPWKLLLGRARRYESPMERFIIGTRRKWADPTVDDRSSGEPVLCDELLHRMRGRGLSAKQFGQHIEQCGVCRVQRRNPSRAAPLRPGASDPAPMPMTAFVVVSAALDHKRLRELAELQDIEVIVLGKNSPAFKDPTWCIDAARLFAVDPELALVVEEDTISPICMDPCILVRPRLLRACLDSPFVITLAELARELAARATDAGAGVRLERLVEPLPGQVSYAQTFEEPKAG